MWSAFDSAFEDIKAESALIHESSYVDSPCRIGAHTRIMPFSHVMAHAVIGDNCLIGHSVTISSGVLIADNVSVMNNTMLNSGVILENNVYCGPSTVFTENRLMKANNPGISKISPTLVKHGAKIGANTTIGSGFTIGRYAFIEAGTVVDGHVPDFAVICGNPVKLIGWQCACGQPLPIKQSSTVMNCPQCGKQFEQTAKAKLVLLSPEENTDACHDDFDSDSGFNPSIRNASPRG